MKPSFKRENRGDLYRIMAISFIIQTFCPELCNQL
uniref:Transposase n=1 Tax=Rhizophora mucronata TaxID=61149 RepID=A0A2P2PHB4_RHIMU